MSINIYRVESNLMNCLFDVRINDIPFIRQFKELPFYSKVTLNEWLVKGSNIITIKLRFNDKVKYSDETAASFSIYRIDSSDSFEKNKTEIAKFALHDYQEGVLPPFEFKQLLVVTETIFENDFSRLIPVELNNKMLSKLYSTYNELFQALKDKDPEKYISLIRQKESAYSLLYNIPINQRLSETRNFLQQLFNDPQNILFDLNKDYLKVQVYNYGKLIALEDIEGNPCIFYANRVENIAHFLPLYCGFQEEKNDFFVIR